MYSVKDLYERHANNLSFGFFCPLGCVKDLESDVRMARLEAIITEQIPVVIIARRYLPSKELCASVERDIALNHRLKGMGSHSAQEFSSKVLELIMSENKCKS